MISTGNDIVALKAIDINRTEQPNFYSKIIIPAEKTLYHTLDTGGLSFANFVWLMWSVKESAFKYLQRINPDLVFSPSKLITGQLNTPGYTPFPVFEGAEVESTGFNNLPFYSGTVSSGQHILYYRSLIYDELLFTVVNYEDKFDYTCWGIKQIDNPAHAFQSRVVREFALKKLNTIFRGGDLQIAKSQYSYPIVLMGNARLPIPLSLAHHHHFVAYSFQLLA